MACERRLSPQQTAAQRADQIKRALAKLEEELRAARAKVVVAANGAIAISGWSQRDDITDACAYRTLQSQGSAALRQAVARAEALSGTKVNERVIASGVHSHDQGKTWHGGH